MQTAKRTKVLKGILCYMNIVAVFLGITSFKLNLKNKRLDQPIYLRFYVVFANMLTLLLMPLIYMHQVSTMNTGVEHSLTNFTDCVGMLITFTAVATSVFLRRKHEAHYARIAQAIFQLDKDYYNKLSIDYGKEEWGSDYFLYFKTLSFSLHAIAPFYGSIQYSREDSWSSLLLALYYGYVYNLLYATLFVYFCFMWLLRRRFSLLNTKLVNLLRALQRSQELRQDAVEIQHMEELGVCELSEISKIHVRLSTLTTRLTAGFNVQILAGLLTQLINGISYGYYGVLLNKGYLDFHLDVPATILGCGFTLVVFMDGTLLYCMAEATTNAHRTAAQLLRRFQTLPLSYGEFEQQCELFALQLKLQNENISISSMFSLRLQTSLAMLEYSLRHILILVQFDYEFHKLNDSKSIVLERFSKLLSLTSFEHK